MSKEYRLIEDGKVLVWPTSGKTDAQKIEEAIAAADARRAGLPYVTEGGMNLGRDVAVGEEKEEKEKWTVNSKAWKPRKGGKKRVRAKQSGKKSPPKTVSRSRKARPMLSNEL